MKLNLPIPLDCLLESLELSYWQDIDYLIENGVIKPDRIREFLALVKNSQQVFPDYDTILIRHPLGVGTVSFWHGQYAKARRQLVEFLEKNIKAGTPIKLNGINR